MIYEMQKKTMITTGLTMMAMGAIGYGAWMMYKNKYPKNAKALEKNMCNMSKNVEKSMEDMM